MKSVNSFIPEERAEHDAILINKKLYFHGGWLYNGIIKRFSNNILFYLDISIPFTISDESLMPWTDLSSIVGAINRTSSSACIDKTSIFFIGGDYPVNNPSITKFDTAIQQWSIPSISGPIPSLKYVPCVSLENKMYIYGGNTSLSVMNKLDTLSLLWSILPYSISSSKTQGTNQLAFNGWNCPNKTSNLMKEETSGQIPLERCGHSSVLISQHNRILLFYSQQDISEVSPIDLILRHLLDWLHHMNPIKPLNPIPPTLFTQPTTPVAPNNINIGTITGTIIGIIGLIIISNNCYYHV
ncbi:7567_t:CDS:2 [Cetraspora pellucida]|uniref:7567_t:CDS:1 n=1 Tax=Cetraspora pellucida TaxID=1433469 RepID=A0A9N9FW91_9GLOM|nr:7567_t:CDS:2 [Cetraspora pellucida]